MPHNRVVSESEWLVARKQHLQNEKAECVVDPTAGCLPAKGSLCSHCSAKEQV